MLNVYVLEQANIYPYWYFYICFDESGISLHLFLKLERDFDVKFAAYFELVRA